MNAIAVPVVSFVSRLPAPPDPKSVWLPPPKTAPMSAPFPVCSSTTTIRKRHANTWITGTMYPTKTSAILLLLEPHDADELLGDQARAAHQGAVDVRLGHEAVDVVGLDATAVQDADARG